MDVMDVVDVARQAAIAGGVLMVPVLLVALLVGITMSVLQAITQVQDQAISFVPKLFAMGCACFVLAPWMTDYFVQWMATSIQQIPSLVLGG